METVDKADAWADSFTEKEMYQIHQIQPEPTNEYQKQQQKHPG